MPFITPLNILNMKLSYITLPEKQEVEVELELVEEEKPKPESVEAEFELPEEKPGKLNCFINPYRRQKKSIDLLVQISNLWLSIS